MEREDRLVELKKELICERHADFWDWDLIAKLEREIKAIELEILRE